MLYIATLSMKLAKTWISTAVHYAASYTLEAIEVTPGHSLAHYTVPVIGVGVLAAYINSYT